MSNKSRKIVCTTVTIDIFFNQYIVVFMYFELKIEKTCVYEKKKGKEQKWSYVKMFCHHSNR